ncbi:MAG: HAD family hydrolase [Thermogutta sp.]
MTAIKAILFDLDDTLYPEIAFVRSGFRVVAEILANRGFGSPDETIALMEHCHWHVDRDRVFQHAAKTLGYPEAWIPELIHAYRRHDPSIHLPLETHHVLTTLCQNFRLGIVTDGHRDVQWRKIRALGIHRMVDVIVTSDDFGRRFWKPDPLPFLTACRGLKAQPEEVIFVGDHPLRDIAGAGQLGMTTVRIYRADGYFRQHPHSPGHPPEYEISNLIELLTWLTSAESIEPPICEVVR